MAQGPTPRFREIVADFQVAPELVVVERASVIPVAQQVRVIYAAIKTPTMLLETAGGGMRIWLGQQGTRVVGAAERLQAVIDPQSISLRQMLTNPGYLQHKPAQAAAVVPGGMPIPLAEMVLVVVAEGDSVMQVLPAMLGQPQM